MVFGIPVTLAAPTELDLNTTEGIRSYIVREAQRQGTDANLIINTIKGESEFKLYVIGDSGLACGLAQYHESSFERHKYIAEKQGFEFSIAYPNYCDPRSEIQLMVWAFKEGERYRNEWTVYRHIKSM